METLDDGVELLVHIFAFSIRKSTLFSEPMDGLPDNFLDYLFA